MAEGLTLTRPRPRLRRLLRAAALLSLLPALAGAQTSQTSSEKELLAGAGARIRRYRMGDLVVRVLDRRGRPVPGARVRVEQTRQAFLFGANIFLLDPSDRSDVQRAYQERFEALFNYATLPFYWGTFERVEGRPDYAHLLSLVRREWWTDTRGETGGRGLYRTRAFLGSHRVTVSARGRTRPAEVLKNEDGETTSRSGRRD